MSEDLGFGGETAGFYQRYRRGYPGEVSGALARACGLTGDDITLDLGCGTGQLTVPIAARVRAVIGVDPEPDMLVRARQSAAEREIRNVTWLLGADTDVPAIASLLGDGRLGVVTVGQALHWMRYRELIPALVPLLRPGGGIAVVTNGTPMWQQDRPWSQALGGFLGRWLGTPPTRTCGTDDASQRRYRAAMEDAGLEVTEISHAYADELDLDRIVAGCIPRSPSGSFPRRISGPPSPSRCAPPSLRTRPLPRMSGCGC
jgi:SAM-dependent methyltransferase